MRSVFLPCPSTMVKRKAANPPRPRLLVSKVKT